MNASKDIIDEVSANDDTIIIEHRASDEVQLPNFIIVSPLPEADYNNVPPEQFVANVSSVYEEMVKWKKNLFLVPSGNAGKNFIKLMSEWLDSYTNATTFQGIALKVVNILPNLQLQKPSANSKTKDHTKALEQRLQKWNDGKIIELLRDCQAIQKKLHQGKKQSADDVSRIFSKLVFEGKIGAALKFLDENAENAVLPSTPTVIKKLERLHPPPAEILPHTLIQGPVDESPSFIFDSINEQEVLKAANQTTGSGGPSLLDAKQWRRLLGSKQFKKEGKELREAIARFAKKIATELVDPSTLETYIASRLIPLNKTPGEADPQIRPIGVGEVLRRIVGKTISWALSDEVQSAGGPLQVSTGLKGGAEAAIHAMKDIFSLETIDGVILVDAENAFNKLNRQVALHNMQYLCPPFAKVLINTYRKPTRLFIVGGGEIASTEGTVQGDTLAMQFYGISTKPIIVTLDYSTTNIYQVWLADDATGAGGLLDLKNWWDLVTFEGRRYGYHVKPAKSWLILKDASKLAEAEEIFRNSPIKITTTGKRHLGAVLGTEDFKGDYIEEKVTEWCERMRRLTEIAKTQPHAAYAAYIHGEQHRYTYFMRTLEGINESLKPLDTIISNDFVSALFGTNIPNSERELLEFPIKEGGLGLQVWSKNSNESYIISKQITLPLQEQIKKQSMELPPTDCVRKAKQEGIAKMRENAKQKIELTLNNQNDETKRNFEQLSGPGASSWLSAIPLKEQGFSLNKSEFQDSLNLRYEKPLKNLPSKCPCGTVFSITHAMNCNKGGFIIARHDNVKTFEAKLLKQVCNDVQLEPPLQPTTGHSFHRSANTRDDARLDIRARSFWRQGQNAYFDVRITNAHNNSQR